MGEGGVAVAPRQREGLLGAVVVVAVATGIVSIALGSVLPVLFVCLGALLAVPVVISVASGRLDPFEPVLFHAVFIGMYGLLLADRWWTGKPWSYDIIPYSVETGVIILTVAYIGLFASLLVGYYGAPRVLDFRALNGRLPTTAETNPRLLKTVGSVYMLLGWGALALLTWSALGGDPLLLFRSSTPRSQILAGSTHLVIASNTLPLGYSLGLLATIIERRRLSVRWLALFPLVTGSFVVVGSRGRIFGIVLLVAVVLFYAIRFGWLRTDAPTMRVVKGTSRAGWAVLSVIGAAVMFPMIVISRHLRQGRSVGEALATLDIVGVLTAGVPDSKSENFLALTQLIPAERPFAWGALYLRVPLNAIPRAIWEDKPLLSLGSWLRRALIPGESGGRPPGQLGSSYANFGWPGIALVGLVTGVFMRAAYEFLYRNRKSPIALVLFGMVIFTVGNSGIDNNTLWALLSRLVLLIPVGIVYWNPSREFTASVIG